MICLIRFRKVVVILSSFFARRSRLMLPPLMCLLAAGASAQGGKPKPVKTVAVTFRDVAPILKERCVVCHNRDTVSNTALSGGLALDSIAALKRGVAGPTGTRLVLTPG